MGDEESLAKKADEWPQGSGNTWRAFWELGEEGTSRRRWGSVSHAAEKPGQKGLVVLVEWREWPVEGVRRMVRKEWGPPRETALSSCLISCPTPLEHFCIFQLREHAQRKVTAVPPGLFLVMPGWGC